MLLVADPAPFFAHDPGRGHPERVARLEAVAEGVARAGVDDALRVIDGRVATRDEIARVHDRSLIDHVEAVCASGGGMLDADTTVSSGSFDAALAAAGVGLSAVEALERGEGVAAFLGVRPPGHHATATRAMGFCLFNNVAVCAAALAARGERVAIVDYDAHHGNGTQDIFWTDPRVLYVSMHQWPLYPGTGRIDERGGGDGAGTTCNFPLPPGATGDVYLRAFDEVVEPLVERFAPDWMLLSIGYDAHRADPLTGLALSAGDYGALAARARSMVPPGRIACFLEGGYDLEAVSASVAATLPSLLGEAAAASESPTAGGPGGTIVEAVREVHALA